MKSRPLFALLSLGLLTLPHALCGGDDKAVAHEASEITSPPFRFSGEFTVEQSYGGDSEVARGHRHVDGLDELYTTFVSFTPRG